MALDEELIQQLLLVFDVELAEQTQLMTQCLLALEVEDDTQCDEQLHMLLRAAHTIKGAARGVGLHDIVEVTHKVETLISAVERNRLELSKGLISLLVEALDCTQDIFYAQHNHQNYVFDLPDLLNRLDWYSSQGVVELSPRQIDEPLKKTTLSNKRQKIDKVKSEKLVHKVRESEILYSVSENDMNALSMLSEDLHITQLQVKHLLKNYQQLSNELATLSRYFEGDESIQSQTNRRTLELVNELSQLSHHTTNTYNQQRPFSAHFTQMVNTLGQTVNSLRLVPFSMLLAPLYRVVGDLSQQQPNKKVDFIIEGAEIKIDRYLYKNLHTPLVHLISNAIDHGIESEEIRRQQGKKIPATLTIHISQQANELHIDIKDDGCGIDPVFIQNKAVKQGIISQERARALSVQESLELVFTPGFSSVDIITPISGRGMGLDIVTSNLRKIKGSISINSNINKGTEISLKFPAILNSEQGLLVKVFNQVFALPGYHIDWVKDSDRQEIRNINGRLLLANQAQELVSVFYLAELMGLPKTEKQNFEHEALACVFISDGNRRCALLVDDVLDEQELIIKPFSYPLLKVPYAKGVTMVVSGELVPVLSSRELIAQARLLKFSATIEAEIHVQVQPQKVLIVDDSITTRTLVSNIMKKNGFDVSLCINGLDAWQELIQNQQYALLITDIEMPIMDGFELVEKVKNNELTRAIPTVIVTSLNSEYDKLRGVQVGADAYISKDRLDTDSLLTIVQQLV